MWGNKNCLVKINIGDSVWVVLAACLVLVYLYLVVNANFNMADGRYALHMDERITYDGVKRIISAEKVSDFLISILDGGDHRYGRILWNSMALASLFPSFIFGEMGQIIASRMLQVTSLLVAFMMLAHTFILSKWLRLLLLATLLSMPYTDYYMTMPKPEPLQILFLAVFLYFYKRDQFSFGRSWIFLGLAFGTKISTLPAILVFIAISLLTERNRKLNGTVVNQPWEAMAFFALGLILAVPILTTSILGLFLFYFGLKLHTRKKNSSALAILVGISLLIFGLDNLMRWLRATFLNTTHGSDQVSIDFISWANYFFDVWLLVPNWLAWVFLLITGFFITSCLYSIYTSKLKLSEALVLICVGLTLNLAIFISAKRLWGFYLYPGMVLTITGIFCLVDGICIQAVKKKYWQVLEVVSARSWALVIGVIVCIYWGPQSAGNLVELSERTDSPKYKIELETYKTIENTLYKISMLKKRALDVAFDPILFIPNSNSSFKVTEFWGPYVDWNGGADVLVFSATHTSHSRNCQVGSSSFNACLLESEGYLKFVIGREETCQQIKCYRRYLELPNGGEILVLERGNLQSDMFKNYN